MIDAVEKTLGEVLSGTRPSALFEAMRHAVLSGGKRVRPRICLASAVAVGGKAEEAIFPACAIELLHAYTLVHDDLPAMDNDRFRRGQPSVWAKFGEADAILAGDALQSLAFATAARTPRNAGNVVAELASAGVGVVCGQVEDLSGDDIDFIYLHKTADLFAAAAAMGAYAGGGKAEEVAALRSFALNLGLAFQFQDDLLDGDSPYPRDLTERKVKMYTAAAVAGLEGLPGDVSALTELACKLAERGV